MKNIYVLIESSSKEERQNHLDLNESCVERGGNSSNFKGVLAQYLNTNIPYGNTRGNASKVHLCHACHNPNCSNPKHLYWGTPSENMKDKYDNPNFVHPMKGKKGRKWTDEQRKKLSNKMKGKPCNNPKGINQYK